MQGNKYNLLNLIFSRKVWKKIDKVNYGDIMDAEYQIMNRRKNDWNIMEITEQRKMEHDDK